MKILLIVPTLNSYQLLPKLVNSLINQTFKSWRVIFVDGSSSLRHKKWLDNLCQRENKFEWVEQKNSLGIYGAMNQGLEKALDDEWVLFWGSDDWCPANNTFEILIKKIHAFLKNTNNINFVICKGTYINPKSNKHGRVSSFINSKDKSISSKEFRLKLINGFTPPHQGVLFPPLVHRIKYFYDEKYKIAGDLDLFFRLSKNCEINMLILDYNLVFMSDNGLSSRSLLRKFYEVISIYKSSVGNLFLWAFIKRYIIRIKTSFKI